MNAVAKMLSINYFWSLIGVVTLVTVGNSLAYTEDENWAFIDKILTLLNNDVKCEIPTIEEVDELQKSFNELEQLYGESLEQKLSEDQKLVRKTLLSQWSSFRERISSAVVIRSAKKRIFLCKIEGYQIGKFGASICTQIKNTSGPISDGIFEKNPLVRYIKHLQTHDVPEPGDEMSISSPVKTKSPTTEILVAEEPTSRRQIEPTDITGPDSAKIGSETELISDVPIADEPIDKFDINLPPLKDDGYQNSSGVVHRIIGKFTIDYPDGQKKITIHIGPKTDDDDERDPLADIPVPTSDDKDASDEYKSEAAPEPGMRDVTEPTKASNETPTIEPEVKQVISEPTIVSNEASSVEPETKEVANESTTTEPAVQFDEFGAELIDDAINDAYLERLVKVSPKDWEFDPIYDNFKWPDENPNACLNETDHQLIWAEWVNFTTDPYAYGDYLDSIAPPVVKQTTSSAQLKRNKKEFMNSLVKDIQHNQRKVQLGWASASKPPKIMPEINRNRWISVADNNFCTIDCNRDYFKETSKRGAEAVKSLFAPKREGISRKRRMLS